jgi:hypothetical protein
MMMRIEFPKIVRHPVMNKMNKLAGPMRFLKVAIMETLGTSSTEISMHTTIGSWPNFEEDRSGAAVTKRIETVVRALEYTYKGNVLVISSLNHLGIQVVR